LPLFFRLNHALNNKSCGIIAPYLFRIPFPPDNTFNAANRALRQLALIATEELFMDSNFRDDAFYYEAFSNEASFKKAFYNQPFHNPFGDEPFKDEPFKDEPFKDEPFKDEPFKDEPFKDEPFGNHAISNNPFRDDPFRWENIKDNLIEDYVRLMWVRGKDEWLPLLPDDSKINEPLTTQEIDFKNKILDEIAKVIDSIFGKGGAF
jgi:hypothetical protein